MLADGLTTTSLPLRLIARGKVRDVYDAGLTEGQEAGALLFVATDRISAFDIVLENVRSMVNVLSCKLQQCVLTL